MFKHKIILTGGGTAGHVVPHLALIPELKTQGIQCIYIGSRAGIEKSLVPSHVPFYSIHTGKLRRYLSLQNFFDFFRLGLGCLEAFFLLLKLRPQLVFSKGGFVSVPVVWAAGILRIPVLLHESDWSPGLANKLCLPFASRIFTAFPETAGKLGNKALCTGIPLRSELFTGSSPEGRQLLSYTGPLPVLLFMGGSLGARDLNQALRNILPQLTQSFFVLHICGKGNLEPQLSHPLYRQLEYVHAELPHYLAATDLLICRAGATTLAEIWALAKPSLLIPLGNKASRGDQLENAKYFEKKGWAEVLWPQSSGLSSEQLLNSIQKTFSQKHLLHQALAAEPPPPAINLILNEISAFLSKKKKGTPKN